MSYSLEILSCLKGGSPVAWGYPPIALSGSFSNKIWRMVLRGFYQQGLVTRLQNQSEIVDRKQTARTYYQITPKGLKLAERLGL